MGAVGAVVIGGGGTRAAPPTAPLEEVCPRGRLSTAHLQGAWVVEVGVCTAYRGRQARQPIAHPDFGD